MVQRTHPAGSGPIPAQAGIGLRHPHVGEFLDVTPASGRSPRGPAPVGWVEVHSENYIAAGGPRMAALERIRRDLPLSCHGVGLSLGSSEGLDAAHLAGLRRLFDRVEPTLVSEHISWSIAGGVYYNDLLPLPLTEEALALFCRNVERAQEAFGRRILVENPSTYLDLAASRIPEPEFIAEIVRRTGCGLLLDVNNIEVSAHNRGFAALDYLASLPAGAVGEIHIAGHAARIVGGETVLIDDHGSAVSPAVWTLLDAALARTGPVPVLVEWDTDIPALAVLLAEAAKADAVLQRCATAPRRARSPAHAA
ncbi:MAG: MNIO family bufferin maturase [Alphaproteobacteria bacterium]